MKSVLISIKPKWCELIASGKKTIEVRKNRPKIETPFKCYIYCTKSHCGTNVLLVDSENQCAVIGDYRNEISGWKVGSGKVIGEFVCDRIAEGIYDDESGLLVYDFNRKEACLSKEQIAEYANGKMFYGWHISDLKFYDEPKELGKFWRTEICDDYSDKDGCEYVYSCPYKRKNKRCAAHIDRPPQSWCYVEERE